MSTIVCHPSGKIPKSKLAFSHGLFGCSFVTTGAGESDHLVVWHHCHVLTTSSTMASMLGDQNLFRNLFLVFTTP